MEYDRYKHSKILFIISMASLIIGLMLLIFSLFILPNLIWDLNYNVPSFIYLWSENLKQNYSYTNIGARLIVFLIFFLPAMLAIFIAYLTANTIENELYHLTKPEKKLEEKTAKTSTKETILIILQLLIIVGLVIAGIYGLQWLISVPPSTY